MSWEHGFILSTSRVDHRVVPPERPQELCGEIAKPADVFLVALVRHSPVHVEGRLVLRREGAEGAPQHASPSPPVNLLLVPG